MCHGLGRSSGLAHSSGDGESKLDASTGPQLFEGIMGAAPIDAIIFEAFVTCPQHHERDQQHACGKQQ